MKNSSRSFNGMSGGCRLRGVLMEVLVRTEVGLVHSVLSLLQACCTMHCRLEGACLLNGGDKSPYMFTACSRVCRAMGSTEISGCAPSRLQLAQKAFKINDDYTAPKGTMIIPSVWSACMQVNM